MNVDIEREVEAEAIVMVVMGEVGGKCSVVSHQTILNIMREREIPYKSNPLQTIADQTLNPRLAF
jgi:hypothetical protein